MSYILDALKKSEQERGHGNIPSVQTVHTSSLSYHDKKALWPYVLIAAVLLNLIAIVYFYLDKNQTLDNEIAISGSQQGSVQTKDVSATRGDEIKQVAVTTPSAETAVSAQQNSNLNSAAIITQSSVPASPTVTDSRADTFSQSPPTRRSTVETNTEVINFHDLPDSIKQQLPTIIVSAHVYSSNPLQRSIVINNNFLEEGEYILDDLILQEITPDGAILYYHGTQFEYPVVSGWR